MCIRDSGECAWAVTSPTHSETFDVLEKASLRFKAQPEVDFPTLLTIQPITTLLTGPERKKNCVKQKKVKCHPKKKLQIFT